VFPQDNAFFIAERIINQFQRKADRYTIKRLAQLVQHRVNIYCDEMAALVKEVQDRSTACT
jgi:hypothetical protein